MQTVIQYRMFVLVAVKKNEYSLDSFKTVVGCMIGLHSKVNSFLSQMNHQLLSL